jgi:hypothetical protein
MKKQSQDKKPGRSENTFQGLGNYVCVLDTLDIASSH